MHGSSDLSENPKRHESLRVHSKRSHTREILHFSRATYPRKNSGMMKGSKDHVEMKEMDLFEEESETDQTKEKPITVVAFYVFGFLIYAIYSLIISGAQDILAGTFVPTSAVLVANVGPYFIVTVVAPYFIQRVPYFPRVLAIFFLEATGLIMVVTTNHVGTRLLGISLSSFGFGLGELSFIAMTSFYQETAVSAFSAGTGSGISLAPLYYTGIFITKL